MSTAPSCWRQLRQCIKHQWLGARRTSQRCCGNWKMQSASVLHTRFRAGLRSSFSLPHRRAAVLRVKGQLNGGATAGHICVIVARLWALQWQHQHPDTGAAMTTALVAHRKGHPTCYLQSRRMSAVDGAAIEQLFFGPHVTCRDACCSFQAVGHGLEFVVDKMMRI